MEILQPSPRLCPCPNDFPITSVALARIIVERIPSWRLPEIKDACVAWLLEHHDGVTVYSGTTGDKAYHWAVKEIIIAELWAVERTICPFRKADTGCALGGCATQEEWDTSNQSAVWGWLPTLILREIDPGLLRDLMGTRQIADAKVAVLKQRKAFPRPRWSSNQPWGAHDAEYRDYDGSSPEGKSEVGPIGTASPPV